MTKRTYKFKCREEKRHADGDEDHPETETFWRPYTSMAVGTLSIEVGLRLVGWRNPGATRSLKGHVKVESR